MGPTFIVGVPRSGTTLLASLLNAHSLIAVPPETHYIEDFYMPVEFGRGVFRNLRFERRAKQFFGTGYGSSFGLAEHDKAEMFRVARQRKSHRKFFAYLMELYAQRHNKPYWVEKTPAHLLGWECLQRIFPEGKFIHIVRDPRDVFLSQTKVPWGESDATVFAIRYREFMKCAKRMPPNSVRTIKYEDLISRPAEIVLPILDWLSVPREPVWETRSEAMNELFEVHKEPWKAKVQQRIDPTNTKKWQTALSSESVAVINFWCKEAMIRHGYDLDQRSLGLVAALEEYRKGAYALMVLQRRRLSRAIRSSGLRGTVSGAPV